MTVGKLEGDGDVAFVLETQKAVVPITYRCIIITYEALVTVITVPVDASVTVKTPLTILPLSKSKSLSQRFSRAYEPMDTNNITFSTKSRTANRLKDIIFICLNCIVFMLGTNIRQKMQTKKKKGE